VRILLFSSRMQRVYFGGEYFHHRNRSSEFAAIWCAFLAPFCSLAFIVGTSHHNGAKTLLARMGAAAAKFVVTAPSGVWIYEQTPLLFCFLG